METGTTEDKPLLSNDDIMRGWKDVEVFLLNEQPTTVRVKGVGWRENDELHVTKLLNDDGKGLEFELLKRSLPNVVDVDEFMRTIDIESRTLVRAVVMEFTYGKRGEKKRRMELGKLLKAASLLNTLQQQSASGPDIQPEKSKDGASQS